MPHIGHYGITVIINTRAPPSLPPSPAFFLPRIVPAAPPPLPPPHPPPSLPLSPRAFLKIPPLCPAHICLSVCLPVGCRGPPRLPPLPLPPLFLPSRTLRGPPCVNRAALPESLCAERKRHSMRADAEGQLRALRLALLDSLRPRERR